MRIVAGAFRGRRLKTPKSMGIRPTTDRVREAVFSIIASDVPQAHVLDLFAGTGAMGLEALSRGAESAVFVDQGAEAVGLVRANIEVCGVRDRARILATSVTHAIRKLAGEGGAFEVIFMDPPYGKGFLEKTLSELHRVAYPSTLVVAEHHVRDVSPAQWEGWVKARERRYGDTAISFYEKDIPG